MKTVTLQRAAANDGRHRGNVVNDSFAPSPHEQFCGSANSAQDIIQPSSGDTYDYQQELVNLRRAAATESRPNHVMTFLAKACGLLSMRRRRNTETISLVETVESANNIEKNTVSSSPNFKNRHSESQQSRIKRLLDQNYFIYK